MSEDFGEKQENIEERLAKFRQEIAEIKQAELAKKKAGEPFHSHFKGINPEKLEKEDMEMYYNFKNLNQEQILAYRDLLMMKHAPRTTRAVFA